MTAALVILALIVLTASAAAMLQRSLIHSALLFVVAWAGIAGFYLWAGAQFAGFAQILVYVGAVSMVVLFAVLLTRQGDRQPWEPTSLARGLKALAVAGALAGVLFGTILATPLEIHELAPPESVTVKQIGESLMGHHAAALLIVGLILTVALIGAVVIASVDNDNPEDAP